MADEKERIYTLTPKQFGALMAAIIAIVGGVPLSNLLNPVRDDHVTGEQGRELERRVDALEHDFNRFTEECNGRAADIEAKVSNNRFLINDCLRRTQ